MKRRVLLLCIALTAIWIQTSAQIRCEQWIDNNRSTARWCNLILGKQTFTFEDISSLAPGLHFLNVLPYDESGEKGVWKCIAFLMPEGWPSTDEATMVEYWVTGYDQQPHRMPYTGTTVTLNIDASNYSSGLHFFNYRTLNSKGEGGVWKCIAFLIPEGWPSTNEATMVEYWVTGYDQQPHRMPYTGTTVTLNIDASNYSSGLHFFNYRTLNECGEGGAWKQIPFYINNGIFDDELMSYEYWIDDHESTVTASGVCPGIVQIEIDGESLPAGKHTLYFRAKTWAEIYGETFSYEFEIVDDWDAIETISDDGKTFDVFGIDGKLIRSKASDLKGLPKGVYVAGGKKIIKN